MNGYNLSPVLPDETIQSYFLRYHFRSGNINWQKSANELFGKHYNISDFNVKRIDYLCKYNGFWLSPSEIIDKMTIFPFLKPFLPETLANEIYNGMISIDLVMKENYFNGLDTSVYICPVCHQDDINNYGEAYLHRIHQIPNIHICDKHHIILKKFKVRADTHNTYKPLDLNDLRESELPIESFSDDIGLNYLLDIIKDVKAILSGTLLEYDKNSVNQKYRDYLSIYYYSNKSIQQKRLSEDIFKEVPVNILEAIGADNPFTIKTWIGYILKSKKFFYNPMFQLILMKFLFGGVEGLKLFHIEKDNTSKNPFGEGPWPCLNPVCKHYHSNVIRKYKEIKTTKNTMYGEFECVCGFTYWKSMSKENSSIYHYDSVKERGEVWLNKLQEMIIDNTNSLKKMARILNCDKYTILYIAKRLNISDDVIQNRTKTKINTYKDYLNVYKKEILLLLEEKHFSSRGQVRKSMPRQYKYLVANDIEWLNKKLEEHNIIQKKSGVKVDFAQRDNEVSKTVLETIDQILKQNEAIIINQTNLAKILNLKYLKDNRYLSRIPKTQAIINQYTETIKEYNKRQNKKK